MELTAVVDLLTASGVIGADVGELLAEVEHAAVEDLAAVRGALAASARGLGDRAANEDRAFEELTLLAAASTAVDAEYRRREADAEARRATVDQLAASLLPGAEPPRPTSSVRLPSIAKLANRIGSRPRPTRLRRGPTVLTAAGEPAGADLVTLFAGGLAREWRANRAAPSATRGRSLIASLSIEYSEERTLGLDERENARRIEAVTGPAALAAAGGVCGPVAADYTVEGVSVDDRPVRDTAMSRFGADRGGVRYRLPHTLAQVHADGPSDVWTEATDAAPGGDTKGFATYSCSGVLEATVDAVTSITRFSNFQARFDPEATADYLQTATADHARLAEATLLATISAGSKHTFGDENLLGAVSDLLAILDRAAAAIRYRNRTAKEAPLRLVYPEWLEDELRADLAREIPGNSGGQSERLAVADAEMARWFAVRNINVTTTLDSPTGAANLQGFAVQADGPLLPWPSKVMLWLYPEGSWQFLDGGILDLGMVRDSVLNQTNELQMFSETFEKAVFRGVESLEILADICPSGARAAVESTTSLCVSGS